MTARYRLRFFLDAGSGVCLWSQNDAAKNRFGYAVETDEIGLPQPLVVDLMKLMADYDATIDWNDPAAMSDTDGGPTVFGHEQNAPFREEIAALVPRIREALGPDFDVESDFED
jgi:hypothetical protein